MPYNNSNGFKPFLYYSLLNVRFGSLLGPRGLLLIYMWGENSNRENPVNCLPAFGTCLLGACLALVSHLWYSISLIFGHLGNHCCRNKPTDALVSRTYSTTIETLGGTRCLPYYPLLLFPSRLRTGLVHFG